MIYTSGTTGRPKGVVHTHGSLAAMVDGMIARVGVDAADRTVLVLPLNHVHGLVNMTLTALAVGAVCEAPGAFDAVARVGAPGERRGDGVHGRADRLRPAGVDVAGGRRRDAAPRWSDGAAGLRLMVSRLGRAAGVDARRVARAHRAHAARALRHDASSGWCCRTRSSGACPATSASRCPASRSASSTTPASRSPDGTPGELLVRGPQVFAGYWERPDATAEAFVDGWFRTGDVAVHDAGGFRLLGRSSVDIIKSGGEKVSALEIEEVYRTHPGITDLAVVGLPDEEWGQRVAAAVVAAPGPTSTPTSCGRGARTSSPRRRSRPASRSSPTSPATPSARS